MTNTLLQQEFSSLNPAQQKAALHKDGPLLVLAGAGSGKTKVVAVRIGLLIASGIPQYNILGLTFTNKAAQEMKERVKRYTAKDVLVSTFHSLGSKILRESIHMLGYKPDFVIYDEDDVEKLLKQIVKETLPDDIKVDIKAIRSSISSAKNALCPSSNSQYNEIYGKYLTRMKECNAVDFDDLLFLPVTLFRNFPDLLQHYQVRWPYVLVDEYQDTNSAQYEFIKLLVKTNQNIFIVGDPDQSIYSWRGADVRNILGFEKDYPDCQVVKLEQNYRSTRIILQAANAVIQRNSSRLEKALWSAGVEGEKLQVFQAQSERKEAEFVANTIQTLQDEQHFSLRDMVIFYRTNFQSRVFEDELLLQRIPYKIIGGISFYLRKEIKDILSFLRLLEQPNDQIAFLRVVNLPKRGFGEQFLAKIIGYAQSHALPIMQLFLEAPDFSKLGFSVSSKQKEGWLDFSRIMQSLKSAAQTQKVSELVRLAIHETRYLEVVDQDSETRQEKRENLAELIVKAEEWQAAIENANEESDEQTTPCNTSLNRFLEEISLASSLDAHDETEEKVSLMTIHNGKGLEFDAVFLVGLEEDLFPHINSKKEEDAVEEERRLFYVGLTRAKKKLYLCSASFRHLFGTLRQMRQSRFLSEIPQELKQPVAISHKGSSSFFTHKAPFQKQEKPKPEFAAGTLVFHPEFGVGKIEATHTTSIGLIYDVYFSKDGTSKKLVAQYAPLSQLKE